MTDFTNKVSVITGAGSGIGRALALELASRGARLAISDLEADAAARTAVAARAFGAEAEAYTLDVSIRDDVFAHADAVEARFGVVNLVINNAGVAVLKPLAEMPLLDAEWLMGINFWGVVHGSKAFLPKLIASGDGHLVNMSSIFGIVGFPEQSAYSAAKFAVRGLTEAVRQEMLVARHPVRVSCVHPGGVKTGLARHARATKALAEVAQGFEAGAGLAAEVAAARIVRGIERGAPRIVVGRDARAADLLQRLIGSGYERIFARVVGRALAAEGGPATSAMAGAS